MNCKNQSKQTYESPKMEIIAFETEDIIVTSGTPDDPFNGETDEFSDEE